MIKRGKRAQSQIITTVLIILLVLAAVIILWAVYNNIIREKTGEIDIEQFNIKLEIKNVYIPPENDSIEISVKRGAGKGDLNSLIFILKDDEGNEHQYTYNNSEGLPDELETIKYVFSPSNFGLSDFSKIVEVSLAYQGKRTDGSVVTRPVQDTKKSSRGSGSSGSFGEEQDEVSSEAPPINLGSSILYEWTIWGINLTTCEVDLIMDGVSSENKEAVCNSLIGKYGKNIGCTDYLPVYTYQEITDSPIYDSGTEFCRIKFPCLFNGTEIYQQVFAENCRYLICSNDKC